MLKLTVSHRSRYFGSFSCAEATSAYSNFHSVFFCCVLGQLAASCPCGDAKAGPDGWITCEVQEFRANIVLFTRID